MNEVFRIYVFGDQTFDITNILSDLFHTYDNPLLLSFLEKSTTSIRHSIARLSLSERESFPRFSKLTDLLPLTRKANLNPALSQYLTCVGHLGYFIKEHGADGRSYPTAEDSCLVGVCTGLLAATAISFTSSLVDLVDVAVETALVAFRCGLCAWNVGRRLSTATEIPGSWTAVLTASDQELLGTIVKQFISEKRLPVHAAPYVSARVSPTQLSLSGPPQVLEEILQLEPTMSHKARHRLPIFSPYHAPHLFSKADVVEVVNPASVHSHFSRSRPIPVLLNSSSAQIAATQFHQALHEAVEEIMLRTMDLPQLAHSISEQINRSGCERHLVFPVATTNDLVSQLRTHNAVAGDGMTSSEDTYTRADNYNACEHSRPIAKSKIAIIGISGRFPKASTMEAFWDVLLKGMDVHELVPASRWNFRTHIDPTLARKNTSATGFGCWLDDPGHFDARYFSMSPREAPQVDPAQRIALMTAVEALEQAGIVPNATPATQKDRVGVYFGMTGNDWAETNSAQDIDTYFIPGGNRAFLPGRINYHYKFSGPSYSIDTACSSSFAAIHMACNALWRNEVDTAIVGGTNILTNPDMTAGLDRGHFLSRTGNCKTFDENADGYCRGEAIVTVILKRLDDAIADKDRIKACILGIATNHNADAESITRPHVGAQKALFDALLNETGVCPHDISYVEMHGTGTQAGDAAETHSVLDTFASLDPEAKRRFDSPLYIGAAKANFGHSEAAAGVTSVAKVVCMFEHSTIPPHCGIKTRINHRIPDLNSRNVFIATKPVSWLRPPGKARQVFLNNFSAAGGNTAMILEDAPEDGNNHGTDQRTYFPVAISARTPLSLRGNIEKMITWLDLALEGHDQLLLPQLSYTTTVRRIHHPHRVMSIGSNLDEIKASLTASLQMNDGSVKPKSTPEYIFAFTGQGSQYTGMGKDLYIAFSEVRADICRYDNIGRRLGFPEILSFFESHEIHASHSPDTMQLIQVCLQMSLFRLWRSMGIVPKAVVGHSLGEYAALCASGVMSEADVIYLVGSRARLLEEKCQSGTHALLAVKSDLTTIQNSLEPHGQVYELSCINGSTSIVLGGSCQQMDAARNILNRRNIKTVFLEVAHAYHTSQMDPILEELSSLASGVTFSKPRIPIISPTLGTVLTDLTNLGSEYITKHCRDRVDMLGSLNVAKAQGLIDEKLICIEIGPALVVSSMLKDVTGPSLNIFPSLQAGRDTWKLLSQALSHAYTMGAEINWAGFHRDFTLSHKCLALPTYSWDLKDYWIKYVHDWTLRKGDPPHHVPLEIVTNSSVHTVVKDLFQGNGDELIVDSDLTREDLYPLVQGHKVYGVPLCTPSVYADIALTVGRYLSKHLNPEFEDIATEITNMNIQSALVTNGEGKSQILRTASKIDTVRKTAACTFSSVDGSGRVTEQHAECQLRFFEVRLRQQEFQIAAKEIRARMTTIREQSQTFSNTYRFSKSMIYKMVGALAEFDKNYRGAVEIILDNDALEAISRVSFLEVLEGGNFHTNPAYIDALTGLGGFVMNANETVDLDKEIYVNHGWESLQFFEQINRDTEYHCHIKMHDTGSGGLWKGTVTIFDKDRVVAVCDGVSLQGVPKRLMSYIVNAAMRRTNGKRTASQTASVKNALLTTPESVTQVAIEKGIVSGCHLSDDPIASKGLKIISEESGLPVDDLSDDSEFIDIGIDSLLSMVISSRFREELDVDFQASIFTDFSTVGDLKEHLQELVCTEHDSKPRISVSHPSEKTSTQNDLEVTSLRDGLLPPDSRWINALTIIAEESGIDIHDLTDDATLMDFGVDSLLSLVIGSRFRDELDLNISDNSLFVDYGTLGELKRHITGTVQDLYPVQVLVPSQISSIESSPRSVSPAGHEDSHSSATSVSGGEIDAKPKTLITPAWSIVLQGRPKRAEKILFLFPDGCGAATSYLGLPVIDPSVAVVGFNSPFMKNPTELAKQPLPLVLDSYIQALQRHQVHGPYHLGGWSAGGILSYAIAQELIRLGEEVASLILIDVPCPKKGLDKLPQRYFSHCASIGLFGSEMYGITRVGQSSEPTRNIPDWLIPHFEATIELLHEYQAPPFEMGSKMPRVNLVWAGECAVDGVRYAKVPPALSGEEDPEGMKFLTERRTDFGPGEWADLFPGQKINIEVAAGEHHFSMVKGRGAERLGEFIRKALKDA